MINKLFWKGGAVLILLGLMLCPAYGRVYFSNPKIGDWVSTGGTIEQGASFTVDIVYNKSDAGATSFVIDAVKLFIQFDTARLENPIVQTAGGAASLAERRYGVLSEPADIIEFDAYSPTRGVGTDMSAIDEIVMYRVTFRLKQGDRTVSGGPFSDLVFWPTKSPYSNRAFYFYVIADRVNREGTLPAAAVPKNLYIADPLDPVFTGLAAGYSGNSATVNNHVGNTAVLNWAANVNLNLDLNPDTGGRSTQTRYADGKLGYHIYRVEGESDFTPADDNRIVSFVTSGLPRGNMGDYVFRNDALADNQPYSYIVRAQDDCSPHHVDTNTHRITVTPHDYTPPDFSTRTINFVPSNRTLQVSWSAADRDSADFGGYVVLRKRGSDGANPLLQNAGVMGPNENGTPPPGETIGEWQVVCSIESRTVTSTIDANLDNGVPYYYRVYAYDTAFGTPHQQGYNWSPNYAFGVGYPGEPPAFLQNFLALSSSTGIILRWNNPPQEFYGGALIVGTTSLGAWSALTNKSQLTDPDIARVVLNQPAPDIAAPNELTQIPLITFGEQPFDLSGDTIYYFKAFAFNRGGELDPAAESSINAHQFSAGVMSGARVGGGPVSFRFALKASRTDKLVVNTIFVPPNLRDSDGNTVTRASQLASLINRKVGRNIVLVVGKWDPTTGKAVGYQPTGEGRDFDLELGVGYQIYISEGEDYSLTLP